MNLRYTFVELLVTITVGVGLALLMTNVFSGSVVVSSVLPLDRLARQSAVRDVMEFADALWTEKRVESYEAFKELIVEYARKKKMNIRVTVDEVIYAIDGNELLPAANGSFPAYKLVVSQTVSSNHQTYQLSRVFFR